MAGPAAWDGPRDPAWTLPEIAECGSGVYGYADYAGNAGRQSEFARAAGSATVLIAPQGCAADVAQLVEHHLAKVRVAGSNPVVRSRRSVCPCGMPLVAEWPSGLGKGLQSPVHGFDSRLRLHDSPGHRAARPDEAVPLSFTGDDRPRSRPPPGGPPQQSRQLRGSRPRRAARVIEWVKTPAIRGCGISCEASRRTCDYQRIVS